MSEVKKDWLSVPWTLELVQKRPFGVQIMAGDREILGQHAYCYSTEQKTRQDNELGVGFVRNSKLNFTTVDEASQHIADQDAIARLISAAPDLLKAVKLLLETHCCDDGSVDYDGTTTECSDCIPARMAIAKAEGKA